jgi:L-asparaginase / beta-aspartyl-peptidase
MGRTQVNDGNWTLVIHGGAGSMTRDKLTSDQDAAIRASLRTALAAGTTVLDGGGSALDAVEQAVRVLEDDPHFNAGRGAVLTYEATISLDAAIMDGRNRDAGAIAGSKIARHPISAARAIMEDSPHVLLAGAGADNFICEQHLETAHQSWFETPERRRQLEEMKANAVGWYDVDLKYGTVGAVARDAAGHLAAATSTGGLTGKRWGRIGDSPLIGAGTYADDRACAISATGAGEFFIRAAVAHEISARMRLAGQGMAEAVDAVLSEVTALGGTGGVIMVAADGTAGWRFTTPGMFRASAAASGETAIAIYGDE